MYSLMKCARSLVYSSRIKRLAAADKRFLSIEANKKGSHRALNSIWRPTDHNELNVGQGSICQRMLTLVVSPTIWPKLTFFKF